MSAYRIVQGVAAILALVVAGVALGDLRAIGTVDDIARAAQSTWNFSTRQILKPSWPSALG